MRGTAWKRENPTSPNYRCSFCGKYQDKVRRLIAGPGGVFICNECITLCNEIITEEQEALTRAHESIRAKVDAHVKATAAVAVEGEIGPKKPQLSEDIEPIIASLTSGGDSGVMPVPMVQIGQDSHGNEHLFLNPEQAAEFLGVHTQTIRGYIRTGKLRAYRLAGERIIRIDRADLLALLQPLSPEDDV